MTTSGVITSSMTAGQMMQMAMQELGALGSGETPTGAEYEDMLPRLNFMLKSWQAKGCNLWRETADTITILADTATTTLDPIVIDVLEARLVQSNTFERPLQRWERGEYMQIPNKAQSGNPVAFYLDKRRDSTTISVWPVPVSDMDIKYTYARTIEDVTTTTETLDVPQMWVEACYMGLASRCASLFGATRIDPNTVADVQRRAAELELDMLDNDRPASVFFGSATSAQYF